MPVVKQKSIRRCLMLFCSRSGNDAEIHKKSAKIISMIENNFDWTTEVRKTKRIASSQLVEETLTAQKRNKDWTKIMNMVHGNKKLSSKIMENWVCMPPHGYSCGYIVRSLKENRSCISRFFCSIVSFFLSSACPFLLLSIWRQGQRQKTKKQKNEKNLHNQQVISIQES